MQLGRYAEYLTKMEFTAYGLDVFTAEVDDKGVDFVIRKSDSQYYDIQVKSSRNLTYIFFPKDKFKLRPNLLAAVVLFEDNKPADLFLIPSETWQKPTALFVSRDYEDKKSLPEWGLNLSRKNLPELQQYLFENVVGNL
ncbi:MAG: DUF4365 domain-containing protein [Chloroflexota bacterium]